MLGKANKVRLFHAMKNKYFLYEIINMSPGVTIVKIQSYLIKIRFLL